VFLPAPPKAVGIVVYHAVPTVKTALKCVEAGVDGLAVEGAEGGGFKNPEETQVICPTGRVANSLSSPLGKNISVFPKRKSALYRQLSRPSRRGVAQRHRRGAGCGGR